MSDTLIDANVLKEAVAIGKSMGAPNGQEFLEIPYAVIPEGHELVSLENQKYPYGMPPVKPHHVKQKVALTDARSFCEYVKLFEDRRTRIFANPNEFSFHAVLDFHGAPNTPVMIGDGSEGAVSLCDGVTSAEFLDHSAVLALSKSEQWNLWMARNEKEIPQVEFAEFIEDNYKDISYPPAAKMLQMAREFSAKIDVDFASRVTPKDGTTQLAYVEKLTTGQPGESGTMLVPDNFGILIPVFFGEKPVVLEARLRFRINSGKLKFTYKLYRPAEVLTDAFNLAVSAIKERLGMDVLMGAVV